MKKKNLAIANGVVGLIGGIVLLVGSFVLLGSIASTFEGPSPTALILLTAIKIAVLALGIIGAVYYRDDQRVGTGGTVLMIVGGGTALIPFLGWVGGIVTIIGGALYLATLKKFNE